MIDAKYFKNYRDLLGFTNQNNAKDFFGAKDIKASVDYNYVNLLNTRLFEIIKKIDYLLPVNIKYGDLNSFKTNNIDNIFKTLQENNIINKLNNQGRRVEHVYFSWMRGFIISSYFLKAIGFIFDIEINKIKLIGDDDFTNLETFKRTPKADLEIELEGNIKLRIEVQSGFQGINDIKKSKYEEAQNSKVHGISSLLIHFDFFNGQVAFVNLNNIEDNDIHWITREQMEGQKVLNIDQNYFIWKLTDTPPKVKDILSI